METEPLFLKIILLGLAVGCILIVGQNFDD
jgi:hypothetical protein